MRSQKAVSAYFTGKQILPFGFAEQRCCMYILDSILEKKRTLTFNAREMSCYYSALQSQYAVSAYLYANTAFWFSTAVLYNVISHSLCGGVFLAALLFLSSLFLILHLLLYQHIHVLMSQNSSFCRLVSSPLLLKGRVLSLYNSAEPPARFSLGV